MNPLKIISPILVLCLAILATYLLIEFKEEPEIVPPEPVIPSVEVIVVERSTVPLMVSSQGTVRARTQTQLTAEVSGRVLSISENFRPGRFISKGEVLVTIDAADYEANLAQAEASLAQAELNLAQEEALAEQAKLDWEDLGRGDPSDLALNLPQVARASAQVKSAQAALQSARLDLEHTEIRAPYDGRVLAQNVDVGSYVSANPGTVVGTVYATDTAEVRLPVTDDEMTFLDLPFAFRDESDEIGPEVILTAEFGGAEQTWYGRIIRSEAAVDERSRLLYVVANVDKPYERDPDFPNRPPLKVGQFVEATIEGKSLENAFQVPRIALVGNDRVLIADASDKLEIREVEVVMSDSQSAVITDGLEPGERVILSPLQYVVEGMPLKVVVMDSPEPETPQTEARD